MKHLKRYAAFCMALVVACSAMAVPASATDYQSTYNFWNWAYDNSWFLGKAIIGFSAGNVCQVSEDGLHHATTHSGGGGSVDGQRVYNCVCDLCGSEFQAVATDLEQTYNNDLPNSDYTYIDNSGDISSEFWWKPYYYRNSEFDKISDNVSVVYEDTDYQGFVEDGYVRVVCVDGSLNYVGWRIIFTPDYDGVLTIQNSGIGARSKSDGSWGSQNSLQTFVYSGEGWDNILTEGVASSLEYLTVSLSAGNYYHFWWKQLITFDIVEGTLYRFPFHLPRVYFKPYQTISHDYNRPSSFNPSFTYQDGDGWQVYTSGSLIDETNLTYYNPVTNTTTNIQNWSYDYSDRSYTVLTDSNNTTTITYGDEYITINEGDNITYNIYYYTAPDSSGDGDSSGSDGSGDGTSLWDKIGELIGSILGGFVDVIGAAIGKVIDSLIDLVTLTIDKLVKVIDLFGSFGDALGILWSWLPEEVVTVLVSGVTVIVFASVIKLFMR